MGPATASACIHEAWSGTYDKGLALFSTIDSLKGDVAYDCRRALLTYKRILDRFVSTQDRAAKAGENLQFSLFTSLARFSVRLSKPFRRDQARTLSACSPT